MPDATIDDMEHEQELTPRQRLDAVVARLAARTAHLRRMAGYRPQLRAIVGGKAADAAPTRPRGEDRDTRPATRAD